MSETGKFLSVGYGGVGQAIPERCGDLGLEHSPYIIKHDGTYELSPDGGLTQFDSNPEFWKNKDVMTDVELAFITVPSSEGQRELEIIEALVASGVEVVTAAKGAVSEHYKELQHNIGSLGISATVGGGTGMLPWLEARMNPRIRQIHAIVNGTLNFILDGVDKGETAGQVIDQAVVSKFAEPDAKSHLEVINGEAVGDIPKKTSILWNVAVRPTVDSNLILLPSDLKQPKITEEDLKLLISQATDRRYILSMIRAEDEIPENDIIAGFRNEIEAGWVIIGGFRKTSVNPIFKRYLRLPGANNGIVVAGGPNESDGIYSTQGPGAGPGPTASAMVQDARFLMLNRAA